MRSDTGYVEGLTTFSSPFGDYQLARYPRTSDPNLQAWEAADRYALTYLSDEPTTLFDGEVVLCNDEFGALATALHRYSPLVWNDSALAHAAIVRNFEANQLTQSWTPVKSSDELPNTGKPISLVVMKIPKSLTFLEDQLARLSPRLTAETAVIGATKAKHMHTSTLKLFEKYLGTTSTSLAKQKARLLFCVPDNDTAFPSPWPTSFDYDGHLVLGHAGVFSHRKLDQGTRFLLEQMKSHAWVKDATTIVDVGCGNGLLGLQAIKQNSDATCVFADRSYLAVDSAERNVRRWFPDDEQHRFVISDALASVEDPSQLVIPSASADLVLCNPPFHDNFVMGEETATKMFSQAAQVLSETGRLVVVANRHLRYLPILKRLFVSTGVAASNRKFVVLEAERPRTP